jgi:hypothetical protein
VLLVDQGPDGALRGRARRREQAVEDDLLRLAHVLALRGARGPLDSKSFVWNDVRWSNARMYRRLS